MYGNYNMHFVTFIKYYGTIEIFGCMDNLLENKVAFLKNTNLFNDLPEVGLRRLAGISKWCKFVKSSMVYVEGDKSDEIYLFCQGKIKFFSHTITGKVVVARITSHADIGGIANLCTGNARWLSAQAMDDMEALRVSRKEFINFIRDYPDVMLKIQAQMERFLHGLFNRFKASVTSSVEQRVFNILYQLYDRFGSDIPFTDEDIASLVGTTRETTVRVMSRLKEQGVVIARRKYIKINDIEKLYSLKQEYPVM